jgi:NADH-quinone oxidoreductase subunit N
LDPLLWVALGMVGIGLGFKVAVVPFHLWAPDAYVGAPTPAAALVASGSKVASFFVLVKLLRVGLVDTEGSASWGRTTPGWAPLMGGMVVLSVLVGNLAAILQNNVKRLLAYSAIAHAGYALLGVLVPGEEGLASLLYYTTTYAVTALGALGVVQWVERKAGGCEFEHFSGLSRRSPVLALCMFIFMLSLAGLPPLAGFFGKFYVFAAAAQVGGETGLLWLVAVAIAGSAVSFYYYLRVLKQMYVSDPPADDRWAVGPGPLGVIVLAAVVVVVAGCRPDWVIGSLRIAVEAASVR